MIIVDIETTKFFDHPDVKKLPRQQQLEAIPFGLAVTYDSKSDEHILWHGEVVASSLWEYLLNSGQIVGGWNIIRFDLPIIKRAAATFPGFDPGLTSPAVQDLFDRIIVHTQRWYALGFIAEVNGLGGKSGDGQQASEWLNSGDRALIQRCAEYCKRDVDLTWQLYQMAATCGLYLPARPGRKHPERENFRIWIDGERWRLLDEDSGTDFREAWDVK
jgi:hypothetical protein